MTNLQIYSQITRMDICRFKSEDAASFQRLRLYALIESPSSFGSSYEEEQSRSLEQVAAFISGSETRVFLGAFLDKALVGVVGIGRETGQKEKHKGFIRSMYVTPGHRGFGVGTALLQEAIELASAWPGLRQLTLAVTAGNGAAIALYARAGFQKCGRAPQALVVQEQYFDEIQMVRHKNAA